MTCEEIFSLHASDTENSDLYDAYRNVPLDSRDEMHKNNTPLHTACYFADITAVGILLERGVDTNARNDDGDIRCVSWRSGTPVRMIPCMPIFPDYCFTKGRR